MFVRKNDQVKVIAGDDRGKTGRVLKVFPKKQKVVVENVNYVWKHLRKSQQRPEGGRLQKEAPIHVSNVRVVCQSCNKPTKIVRQRLEEPKAPRSVRICKLCGQPIAPKE
jgi:large subunit ribosomal protein L24